MIILIDPDVTAGNLTICCGQQVACELRVELACYSILCFAEQYRIIAPSMIAQ
jgi:hypothetical protein